MKWMYTVLVVYCVALLVTGITAMQLASQEVINPSLWAWGGKVVCGGALLLVGIVASTWPTVPSPRESR